MFRKEIIINTTYLEKGFYACSRCGNTLFEAAKKFDAGCGFPSFWQHIDGQVKLKPLYTYGRQRIQLLCGHCDQHLGHLFDNPYTPSKVRYCITATAIQHVV